VTESKTLCEFLILTFATSKDGRGIEAKSNLSLSFSSIDEAQEHTFLVLKTPGPDLSVDYELA
jgi:hypothetical protein